LKIKHFEFGVTELAMIYSNAASGNIEAPQGHLGTSCAVCGQSPIQGSRFKCMVCTNVNLCSECEAKGTHAENHALLKFKTPSAGYIAVTGASTLLGKKSQKHHLKTLKRELKLSRMQAKADIGSEVESISHLRALKLEAKSAKQRAKAGLEAATASGDVEQISHFKALKNEAKLAKKSASKALKEAKAHSGQRKFETEDISRLRALKLEAKLKKQSAKEGLKAAKASGDHEQISHFKALKDDAKLTKKSLSIALKEAKARTDERMHEAEGITQLRALKLEAKLAKHHAKQGLKAAKANGDLEQVSQFKALKHEAKRAKKNAVAALREARASTAPDDQKSDVVPALPAQAPTTTGIPSTGLFGHPMSKKEAKMYRKMLKHGHMNPFLLAAAAAGAEPTSSCSTFQHASAPGDGQRLY